MTGYIKSYSGIEYELPVLLSWDISHGIGTPCDSFEVTFAYDATMLTHLSNATRFRAVHGGVTVFTGVVDEFEAQAGGQGQVCALCGRSLAALLLDNEAEAAEYYGASMQFILDKHVYPWGISSVRYKSMSISGLFTVSSGASSWGVLEEFAWFGGGVRPRFTKDGILLLNDESGDSFSIDATSPISAQTYGESRYGVISTVLVKNKSAGTSSTVNNDSFIAKGGKCRRVVNVPRTTSYDTMRYTGKYQIESSARDYVVCTLTMPELFTAFPGDKIALKHSPLGITGSFTVEKSRCFAGDTGAGTTLTLYKG